MEGQEKFRTPNGNVIEMFFREGTNDRSIIESITTDNEYQIPTHYTGTGVDVGAHIGTWAIAACADNPGLAVVAIEAVYENVLMMQRNVSLNGMQRRIKVLYRAASSSNHDVRIAFAFRGNDIAENHRFIGNQDMPDSTEYEIQMVQGLRLTRLARFIGEPIRIMKIDCEGCEWKFLKSSAIQRVEEVVGEFHHGADRLQELLGRTHTVEVLSDEGGFGLFRATRG